MNNNIQAHPPVNLDLSAALGVIRPDHVSFSVDVDPLEGRRHVSEPDALSREQIQNNLHDIGSHYVLPVVIRPSGVGPGFNRSAVHEDIGGVSKQIPVVIANNQPIGNAQIKRRATDDFKDCCTAYCCCQETDVPVVRKARCMTYYGGIAAGSLLTGGILGAVVCCCSMCVTCSVRVGKGEARQGDPCSAFPCPGTSFKKSCLPCI
ncbi:MAG: hypothetical protein KAF64_11905 [Hydrogenophaga sp.]|uniref:hypothetical protein n=1 Tax=Hydrogenophaga sp. TaxID=1904254 RepID=UPI0025C34F19|nr:hypothetical protein [Hydrogenophaga sp.]MBU7574052.1 hypothetical protein [Hydrogenophaga sp.]